MTDDKMDEARIDDKDKFNENFIQLAIGLQSTAWICMGKVMNPRTGKQEIDLDRARDSIDTMLMLKEKTKGNLSEVEKNILEGSLQDIEMNFIEVSKIISEKEKKEKEKSDENKEEDSVKEGEEKELKKEDSEEKDSSVEEK